ncbi:uncharacterized protein MKZ38_005058 [Zalerion maritima]|uniref:Uncharacterized protein n=1 Tax=Zalerion maritima TaxID=339359 RepID=A0AAD5RLM7_9PEZI|nr:uncharacterized protein MKZ38_005058 [Zalerion maritima]
MYDAMDVDEDSGPSANSNVVNPRLPKVTERAQKVQVHGLGNTKRRKHPLNGTIAAWSRRRLGAKRDKREKRGTAGWISILEKTTLPDNITSAHHSIISASKELDNIVYGRKNTRILQRLARKGQAEARLRCLSSVAIQIYMSAQGLPTKKDELSGRTRFARRLRDLTVQPPFFLVIYSAVAVTVA